jgi:hypothetical protein
MINAPAPATRAGATQRARLHTARRLTMAYERRPFLVSPFAVSVIAVVL